MRHIYGPVKSRRIGFSLGLSLTPYKTCNFDCIYCQLGRTTELTGERSAYVSPEDILEELRQWILSNPEALSQLDCITIAGQGEPTLNTKIEEIIQGAKKLSSKPVAVITNASLLSDKDVRLSLSAADLIVPSLDAVIPEVFSRINRPIPELKIEEIIEGIVSLRKEFRGKIWLEVMLVSGINDDLRYIKKLGEAIERINPDKIQINSPVRATTEQGIAAVDRLKLKKIKEILGEKAEIL